MWRSIILILLIIFNFINSQNFCDELSNITKSFLNYTQSNRSEYGEGENIFLEVQNHTEIDYSLLGENLFSNYSAKVKLNLDNSTYNFSLCDEYTNLNNITIQSGEATILLTGLLDLNFFILGEINSTGIYNRYELRRFFKECLSYLKISLKKYIDPNSKTEQFLYAEFEVYIQNSIQMNVIKLNCNVEKDSKTAQMMRIH
jgi:hypothetical protein